MNFDLSPAQLKLKDAIVTFCTREMPPGFGATLDKTGEFPYKLYRKCVEGWFFGIPYPAEYVGADGDLVDVIIVTEHLASSSLNVALMYLIPVVFTGMFLLANGTEEQNNAVLANSALALHLVFSDKKLTECVEMARESLESGKALKKLKAICETVR